MLAKKLLIESPSYLSAAKGHTLVELLLILSLMAVVLQTMPSAYSTVRKTMITTEQEKQSMQRFEALYYHMRPWVESAGYYGCASEKNSPEVVIHGVIPYSGLHHHEAVTVYKSAGDTWYPPLPQVLEHKPAAGTDAIQMEGAGPWFAHLTGPTLQKTGMLPLGILPPKADWFVISDCQHVELFTAEPITINGTQGIQPHVRLKYTYDQTAVLSPWQINVFYLDKHPQTPSYTLNRKSLIPSEAAQGLISGIESWSLSLDSDILQVDIKGAEPLTVWMRFDHAA